MRSMLAFIAACSSFWWLGGGGGTALAAPAPSPSASSPANPGVLSGTIDLRTYAKSGPARIPPGASIEFVVTSPGGRHDVGVADKFYKVGSSPTIPFVIGNLPLENLQVEVMAGPGTDPNLDYSWLVNFRPHGAGVAADGTLTLTPAVPTRVVNLTLRGVSVPAKLPTPLTNPPTTGSAYGQIELDDSSDAGGPAVDPASLSVTALRTDTQTAAGRLTTFGPELRNPDGTHFIEFRFEKLPLDVPIAIAVAIGRLPGASPYPTGFFHLIRFRPKDTSANGDAFVFTLDAAHSAYVPIIRFVPYELEVPPLPPTQGATP